MGSQGLHRADVVEMGVRQPDGAEFRFRLLDRGDQLIAIVTRVHDRRVAAVAIDDEVGVFLERPGLERENVENRGVHAVAIASRRAVRYFSAAMAAVVASPTAVVTCRVSCTRTSPAANSPGIDVCMWSLVSRYPMASCSTCSSMMPVLGRKPMKTNRPVAGRSDSTPVFTLRRAR